MVRLHNEAAIPLAVIKRRAKRAELSVLVPQLCGVVWEFLKSQNLRGGRHVALYLNGNMDIEVGCEMSGAFEQRGDVVRSETPSGSVASATHMGPYQGLGSTHDAIRQWCNANGYRPTGKSWEIYGHWQPDWNAHPSRIRTDVFYEVAPAT